MRIGKVYDKEILVAALLHDVMDEAGTTYEEISNLYGKTVSQYVQEMTVKKELTLKERKKFLESYKSQSGKKSENDAWGLQKHDEPQAFLAPYL